ncbi:MAG TPA: DUF4430 domain-containing protein [Candidatus Scybalocola faecigallinarum]|uniref:DUF4430 domain-containing protein n=1 Tax=Candidatus Scybalocola faecigallinarum TaxID=2840941 RepID=A0A9D1JR28_9FIRM|nr:DUF4430 domain-containing protein [Candidatus Scybalocola faecigallinarum]
MKKENSRKAVVAGIIILVVLVAVMAAIYFVMGPKTQAGSKTVTIEVINSSQETASYQVQTDARYLQQVMDEAQGLSYETDSGNMVVSINGETADYNADQAYWAFYLNGEYCNFGIDQQPVADGDIFTIEYTKG